MTGRRPPLPREQEALVAVLDERFEVVFGELRDVKGSMTALEAREKERNGSIGKLHTAVTTNEMRWNEHLKDAIEDQRSLGELITEVAELRKANRDKQVATQERSRLWKLVEKLVTLFLGLGGGALIVKVFS